MAKDTNLHGVGADAAQSLAGPQELAFALQATSDGFLILGSDGQIRFANEAFRHLFGTDLGADGEVISSRTLQKLLAVRRFRCLQEPVNHEVLSPRGLHVRLRARPMHDGSAVICATDITQAKLNDQTLRQRLAAIAMSQDGIAVGDTEGRIVQANPSLIQLWGLDDEVESFGRRWSWFYDEASQESFAADAPVFAATGVWRGRAVMIRDGVRRTHDVSLSRVPDVGTILLVRDVTRRVAAEQERNRLRRQLDQAQMQEWVSQISAGLAHDLNNLLSGIIGFSTVISSTDTVPKDSQQTALRINAAAERAAQLVDGFLDMGMREREAEELDLCDILATTVELASGGAPPHANLKSELPDRPIILTARQTDVLQVVMNLIVNGIDALEGATGEIAVSLNAPRPVENDMTFAVGTPQPGLPYATITVADTGVGMPPETAARMLDPYFTTKGNAGSGLGLAIVLSTLTSNGGLLNVHTAPGIGTAFTVYWPTDPQIPQATVGTAQNRHGLPIMVVDDDDAVAAAVGRDLSQLGYEIAETTDAATALEAITEDPNGWACLVTDYDMPHLTGGDLLARLADTAPDLPVIVMSARAKQLSDPRLRRAAAVLAKPVNSPALEAAITAALKTPDPEAPDENTLR